MYRVCTRFKEGLLGAQGRGDSRMKMDGIFVAWLRIDHGGNQCDMYTYCGL